MPPERLNQTPSTTSEPTLERVGAVKAYILKHRTVLATLTKNARIKMGFTTDPGVTGYFAPKTQEVQVGLRWIAEAGLDDTQALFVPVHEFGHVKDFEEDPEAFLGSFERHTRQAKDFVDEVLRSHYQDQPVPESLRTQVEGEVVSRVLGAVNALDDLAVNEWALQQVPKLRREQAVSRLYHEILYQDATSTEEESPEQPTSRAEELLSYLVRRMMITHAPDTRAYSPEVLALANNPVHHWRVLGTKPVSLTRIVEVLSSYIRSHKRFFRFSERMAVLEKLVLPVYLDLLKQELLPNLPDPRGPYDPPEAQTSSQPTRPSDSTQSFAQAPGQPKPPSQILPGEGVPHVPSSMKPTTEAEVEQMRTQFQEVLEDIQRSHEAAKMSPEERKHRRQVDSFLRKNPEVTRKQYLEYERTRSEVAKPAAKLAALWSELLGRQQELVKTGSHLSPSGGRLDSRALIRNYAKIKQGVPDVAIFQKTERGVEKGDERPKEVRFRVVLDRSGSMVDEPKALRLMQQLYVTLFDSFDLYKAEALARGAMREEAFLDIRSECLGYGSVRTEHDEVIHEMKPMTPPRASQTEKAQIIQAYAQTAQSLIGNDDHTAVREVDQRIRAAQAQDTEKVLDIVFYLTDGAPLDEEALRESLQGVHTENTLWRAFQLESEYAGFDAVWNQSDATKGVGVTMETLIPKMVESIREILGSL